MRNFTPPSLNRLPGLRLAPALLSLTCGWVATGTAQIQFSISHEVSASTGTYDHKFQSATFPSSALWDAAGRTTEVNVAPVHHPFDPPDNVARAWSRFNQPNYGLSNYHSQSLVLTDYSGISSPAPYLSSTYFEAKYFLLPDLSALPAGKYHLKMAVPTHGLLTARGNLDASTTSSANAELFLSVHSSPEFNDPFFGAINFDGVGTITVASDVNVGQRLTTGGLWAGMASPKTMTLPTGIGSRTENGYELSSLVIVDLGEKSGGVAPSAPFDGLEVTFRLSTRADTDSSNGAHAMADFSATSGFEFQVFDSAGNRVQDFTVRSVPEPNSILLLGVGLFLGTARSVRRARRDLR